MRSNGSGADRTGLGRTHTRHGRPRLSRRAPRYRQRKSTYYVFVRSALMRHPERRQRVQSPTRRTAWTDGVRRRVRAMRARATCRRMACTSFGRTSPRSVWTRRSAKATAAMEPPTPDALRRTTTEVVCTALHASRTRGLENGRDEGACLDPQHAADVPPVVGVAQTHRRDAK